MGGFQVLGEVDLNESQGKAPSSGLDVLGEVDLPEEKPKTYLPEVNKAVASVPKPDSPLNYAVPGNEVTGAVTGFFPSKAPRNGPRGQLPATPPLEAVKAALEATPPQSETPLLPGAATAVTAGQHLATPGQRWQGATEAVQAAGEAATPFMGPAATEMAAAPALAPALKFAAGLGVGIGGQPLAEKGAEKLGASPEQQKFWGELAFWAPQIAGLLASQVKGGVDVTPDGTRAAVSTPGGKVGAGVAVTPEGVTVRGKVGPFEGSKTFARGPQPAGPAVEAPTIEAQPGPPPPSDDPAITSMANAHAADTAAAKQAAGIPEPPQPTILDHPDAPPELQQNRISPESIGRMATFVAGLPEAERAQAMQEAHGTLTQALTEMGKKGPIQMPDGTLALVKDPKAAEKIALSIINDAVKEHDKASARTSGDSARGEKGAVSSQEPAPVEVLGEVPLEPTPAENASPASKDAQQPALKKGDTAVLAKETKVGDKVLPSGTSVKIQYVHPNNLLVRAVTEDGTKISRGVAAFTKGTKNEPIKQEENGASVQGTGEGSESVAGSVSGPPSGKSGGVSESGVTESGVSGTPDKSEPAAKEVKTSEPEHPNLNLGEHAAHTEMVPTKTISDYGKDVEMLPVEELEKLATHDRRKEPFGTDMDELKADIQKNGIKEPLELGYNHAEKKAVIWDGNHRLGVAKELGIKELPVRVKTTDFPTAKYGKEVSGFKGEGTVPERLKPSEIGIGAREVKTPSNYPTPESRAASQAAFEKNYPPGTLPEKSLTGDALRAWQQSIGNPLPKEEDPGAKVRAKNPEPTRAEVAAAAEKKVNGKSEAGKSPAQQAVQSPSVAPDKGAGEKSVQPKQETPAGANDWRDMEPGAEKSFSKPNYIEPPKTGELWYHGRRGEISFTEGRPAFFTRQQEGAAWYATNRGDFAKPETIGKYRLDIKNPARYRDLLAAIKATGATAKDIQQNSPYRGENNHDALYVPKVREHLAKQGFDGYIGWDNLERTDIEAAVPFSSKQITPSETSPAPAKGANVSERPPVSANVTKPDFAAMGKKAFEAGKMRVPSLDPELMEAIKGVSVTDRTSALATDAMLKEWLKGWDQANLAEGYAPAESLTPEPTEKPPAAETPEGEQKGAELLAQAVYEKLKNGESLGNVTELNALAEKHFGAARTSGTWTPKDAFDAMEVGVNKYLLDAGKELMEMPAAEGLAQLRELMPRITSQGVRTEEQIKNQQFSTPPTESYVAAKVAGLKPSDVVLEPSAGNGGLAVWPKAIGAEVHVNEIAPRRQEMLELAGFGKPTAHDGEIINSLLDPKIKPTVVLMNPPFSASTQKSFEAKNRNQYGFNHVDSALQRLEDGGRLVAILGGGQANEPNGGASLTAGASGKWFERIAEKYNVRANVRINGKEYQKYGTAFATRIIVIDKDGPTPSRVAPGAVKSWESVVQKNVDTLEEAYNALSNVAESRPEAPVEPGRTETAGQTQSGTGVVPSGSAGTAGNRVPVRSEREAPAGDELPSRSNGPVGSAGGNGTGAGSERTPVRESETGPAEHPETKTAGSPESRPENADVKRPLSGTETSDPALELGRENSKLVKREEEDSSAYVAYRPTLKGPAHPANIVETRTMATVPLPEITYKPSLPESVVKDGKLSAVQLEAISIAGQQNDIVLPDGSRATALIGDGTGVGKGRIGAGVLWDNWRKGRKRLVWVSEKWDLMQDAIRDLQGIGAHDLAKTIKPFGKISAATPIDHEGILFSTYALIRSEDKKGNSRVNQLQQWLKGKDEANGAYILYDESHNLKNAVAATAQTVSQIGAAVKKMMADTPNLRSVSLSATAATDVINLGYLDRLGLWGPGTPFPNGFGEFQAQIASGGMSAMEMVARELKAQGKYVSRTLSYKGVTYEEIEHVLTEEQKDLYRTASKAWASVVQQAEDTIKNTTNGGAQAKSRFMSLFYGAQLRFFNVLLTTLKIPTAVEQANKALAADKSVVITLVNTNEAAQNREKNRDRGGEDSDEIPDYDFGPGEMLKDLVREHYPVQQFVDDVDSEGNPIKVPAYTTDADGRKIPLINPQAEKERDQLIAQLDRDLKMPANPLDILINSLGGPKKVAELTGRKERYDETSGKFVPRGDPNVKRDEINLSEMRAFQGGKKRVAILSSAAGTGISLHAGNDAVNQQKRRHITLQPGWSADKAMQMMGRTHRSNEAHQPEYAMLTSDLGGEKRFTSTLAKRMGSLGALSKGQSNANAGADLMEKVNFESDQGRQATTSFYNAMLRNVSIPGTKLTGMQVLTDLRVLKPAPGGGGMTVPPADRTNVTRLLNRLLALDPDVQNSVYNYFYDIFQATVQQAMEDGTLDTGVKTLPGDDFSVKEERAISKDPKTGAETYYYPVDAEVRTNRMSVKALDASIKTNKKRNPVIMRNKEGKVSLVMEASPIVHASGSITPASYVVSPENGNAKKVPTHSLHNLQPVNEWAEHAQSAAEQAVERAKGELDYSKRTAERYSGQSWAENRVKEAEDSLKEKETALADATKAAADAPQWARDQWEKQHSEAPSHTTKEHHLIGGAVLRWWNPIRDAAQGLNIYTALDSKTGKRVVGVDIPPAEIRGLLQRITGGASTVDASQLHTDVLKNGLQYSLEQGIQVRRGRVNRENVVQFIPPNQNIANNLKRLGLVYERGIQPIYYLPNAEGRQETDRVAGILDKILKEYPVKQEAPKGESLLTGESGELNISRLGEVVASFVEKDVQPALQAAGIGLKAVPSLFVRALYPRIEESNPVGRALGTAAPADAVDALMKIQGDRAKNLGEFDLILKGIEKMFDRLPEEERVDFIERIQNGEEQPTPDLLDLASMFKQIMDAQRDAEEEALNLERPQSVSANNKSPIELSRKENYFHNWWETPPGKEAEEGEGERVSRLFTPRRPLEGSKGYNKKQSYTLRSGMEAGGEPVTTNPVRILRHRLEDGMKFITARRAWYELKELGLRSYVKKGAPRPAGFDKVDDKIAKVWFPATLDFAGKGVTAPHELGEWYVEANTARLLNNMLSVDKIRGNPAGRGLMWLKNASTAVELGLSPFHAVFESIEAMSSMLSLGMQRAYNQGIRQGKPAELAQGIKEMISSPAAPITLAREGAAVPAYIEARARLGKIGLTEYGHVISGEQPHGVLEAVKQFQELRKEKSVQRLIKQYPDLDQLVDDMFQGGLIIGQHRDYQVKALGKTAAEAFSEGNPIGAVWRAIPTITQGVMYPLFNWYIPSLKYSLFLKMMSEAAGEHARELESGELTRATLARKVADSVENRFGELNFDNLFLNRTTKTALQFLFRSMTYKLGTVRELSGAAGGHLRELGIWAKDAADLLGGGGGGKDGGKGTEGAGFEEEPEPGKTFGEKALPRLDSRAAWVMSLMIVTAMLGSIAAKLLTKKYPWQWIQDDEKEGMSAEGAMFLEVTHPRTGETDSRGKPVRISLPTYWKDVEHAAAHPAQYVLSSLSGIVSKLIDTAENKDYFGNYVYNPTAPISTKLKQAGKYNFPMPFVASNFIRGKAQNESKTAWLSAFGFPKAPSDLDFTPAEKLAQKVIKQHEPPATPEELEQWREKHQAFIDGKLPLSQARGFMKRARESMLQRQMKNSAVSYTDARRIYELANPDEKKTLDHIMREKRARLMREHRGGEVKTAEASN